MTDLTSTTVSVHVVGLTFPDEKAHVTKVEEDKKELFPEPEKDGGQYHSTIVVEL